MLPADYHFIDQNWKSHFAVFPTLTPSDPKELGYGGRDYQIRRFNELRDRFLSITVAPTGSGKSFMSINDGAVAVLESDYQQKQLFLVNMLDIGTGFTQAKHPKIKIDGRVYDWEITTRCLDGENTVQRTTDFLLQKPHSLCKPFKRQGVIGGVTAIASYSAFTAAWKQMTENERRKAIKNVAFRIDEVQHISGVSDNEAYELNRMGEFLKYLLQYDDAYFERYSIAAHLMTATFFRGNRHAIVDGAYYDRFAIFRVPFLEHWVNLHLRELIQIYASYKDGRDLMNQILEDIRKEKEPSLIIVPNDGTKFFKKSNKFEWVRKIVVELGKIYGPDKVLDLVTPERQQADKKRFMSETKDFMVVVTCVIGKEGSDWPACSRIFNTVLDQSVLAAIQKLGRALRAYPGKTNIRMVNYIEHFDKWDDEPEKIRQKLSDRLNCVMVQSIMDDDFYPLMMPTLPTNPDGDVGVTKFVTLADLYGDKRNDVVNQLMRAVLSIPEDERTIESINEVIDDVIEIFSDFETEFVDPEDLRERLRREVLRRQNPKNPNLKIEGMIIDHVRKNGWDKVVREDIAHGCPFIASIDGADIKQLASYLDDWTAKLEEVKKLGLRFIMDNKADYPDLYCFAKKNTKWVKLIEARNA
jgi:hypothetical protein